ITPVPIMSLTSASTLRVVLYEGADSQPLGSADLLAALTALLEKGFAVTRARNGEQVASHPRGPLLVLGKFEGESPKAAAAATTSTWTRVQNIAGFDAQRIADCAEAARAEAGAAKHGDWKPWFPVIDYERCTNCMQCLS